MTDYSSLQNKVTALKAKVEQDSITPTNLGVILEDTILLIKSIDMTGLTDDITSAVSNATSALEKANLAISNAQTAQMNAVRATSTAMSAQSTADAAKTIAEAADAKADLAQPVRCTDEQDLATKAASSDYQNGQQFYIPETD